MFLSRRAAPVTGNPETLITLSGLRNPFASITAFAARLTELDLETRHELEFQPWHAPRIRRAAQKYRRTCRFTSEILGFPPGAITLTAWGTDGITKTPLARAKRAFPNAFEEQGPSFRPWQHQISVAPGR